MPEDIIPTPEPPTLGQIVHVLEEQLRLLDELGSMIAAAHISAAVEHLRLDLASEELLTKTRH